MIQNNHQITIYKEIKTENLNLPNERRTSFLNQLNGHLIIQLGEKLGKTLDPLDIIAVIIDVETRTPSILKDFPRRKSIPINVTLCPPG